VAAAEADEGRMPPAGTFETEGRFVAVRVGAKVAERDGAPSRTPS
jgi:hypothetical protein